MLLCHSFICQQRCQKTSPVGLLQCLATKHLSPNAFKWFSRAGKARVFGRDGDAFLYLRSLPQREVLLGSILADGRKLKENILFLENCSSMECSLQGCVLDALALPTSQGRPRVFKATPTSAAGCGLSSCRRCGGSHKLNLEP